MPSIRAVAKEAGVSIATVSRVLNSHPSVGPEVRTRVLSAANRLGYISNVGKRATTYLAFTFTGPVTFSSPYDSMLMAGVHDAMEETGFDLAILSPQRDKKPNETYSQYFMRKGVRGAILRTTTSTRHVCIEIADEGFPCVVVGSRFEDENINYVYGDSRPTSRQAIEHLISLGHRRIGIALGLIEDSDHTDRLNGYRQALKTHDLPYDPNLIYRIPAQRPDGAQLMKRILASSAPPTALFITDPDVAIGALNQANLLGVKIPDELSIVGMDDGDNRKDAFPKLSAVCQDATQIGYEAGAALKRIIDTHPDERQPVRLALPTWFEVHDTTAPPPGQPTRVLPNGTRVGVES